MSQTSSSSSSSLPTDAAAAAPAAAPPKTDQSRVWHMLLLTIVMVVSDPAGAVTIFDAAMSPKLSTTGNKRLRVFEDNIAVARDMIVKGMPHTDHAIQVSYVALLCIAALLGGQRLRSVFIDVPNGLVGANGQRPVRFDMTTADYVVNTPASKREIGSSVFIRTPASTQHFDVKTAHQATISADGIDVHALSIYNTQSGPHVSKDSSPADGMVAAPKNSSCVILFPAVVRREKDDVLPTTAKGSISKAWDNCRIAAQSRSSGSGSSGSGSSGSGSGFGGGAASADDDSSTMMVDFCCCLQLLKRVLALFVGADTVLGCADDVFAAYDGLLRNVPPSLMLSLFEAIMQSLFEPGTFGRNSSFLFKHLSCGSAALAWSCFCSSACLQTLHSACSSSTPCEQDALGFCLEPGDCRYLEKDAARSCGGKAQVMFSDGRLVYVSAKLSAEVLLRLGGEWAYMLVVNKLVVAHGLVRK